MKFAESGHWPVPQGEAIALAQLPSPAELRAPLLLGLLFLPEESRMAELCSLPDQAALLSTVSSQLLKPTFPFREHTSPAPSQAF